MLHHNYVFYSKTKIFSLNLELLIIQIFNNIKYVSVAWERTKKDIIKPEFG